MRASGIAALQGGGCADAGQGALWFGLAPVPPWKGASLRRGVGGATLRRVPAGLAAQRWQDALKLGITRQKRGAVDGSRRVTGSVRVSQQVYRPPAGPRQVASTRRRSYRVSKV